MPKLNASSSAPGSKTITGPCSGSPHAQLVDNGERDRDK